MDFSEKNLEKIFSDPWENIKDLFYEKKWKFPPSFLSLKDKLKIYSPSGNEWTYKKIHEVYNKKGVLEGESKEALRFLDALSDSFGKNPFIYLGGFEELLSLN